MTYKLLYLEWTDAGIVDPGQWLSREDVDHETSASRFLNRSVGWLIKETDEALVISGQIAMHADGDEYDLVMYIPKSLIKKKKILKIF